MLARVHYPQLVIPLVLACALAAFAPSESTPSARAGTSWSARAAQYVTASRRATLAAAAKRGIRLPTDFVSWIDGDPVLRNSVYGCRKDPLPVLLGLRSLEIDLGKDVVRKAYPQFALAIAMQGSYATLGPKAGSWNDGDASQTPDTLPDTSPRSPLTLTIPSDPRVVIDTNDPARPRDRDDHIINFLEDHAPLESKHVLTRGLTGADLISLAALQREFNEYMKARGQDVSIDCGDGAVNWNSTEAVHDPELRKRIAAAHDMIHSAYRAKGRMPTERDRPPTPSESMAWFVRNDRSTLAPSAKSDAKWPRFPLNAPWPVLLMLAADDQPLREREEVWQKFVHSQEARTYGEYIGAIAQQFDMQSARRLAPLAFSYGSIQMMWKDGGVCGTMGNIGARTERILGVPASTAGQPGHCAMVQMDFDAKTGLYNCKGAQYASGGDEVTTVHAGWNYDDRGGRRGMIFHQTVAWGVNVGLQSFVDTLVMRRAFDALSADERANQATAFLAAGLKRNPYAFAVVEAAISAAADSSTATRLFDDYTKAMDAANIPSSHALYRDTVRNLAQARALALSSRETPTNAK